MRNRVFTALLAVLSVAGSTAFLEAESTSHCQSLQCRQIADAVYELNWENEAEDDKCEVFHLFTADDWEELMPLVPAHAFLASPQADHCFLLTTSQKRLPLTYKPRYFRLIAQSGDQLTDLVHLVKLASEEESDAPIVKGRNGYSPQITDEIWQQVEPYFLPEDHAIKKFMDKVCGQIRILASTEALERAGFTIVFQQAKRGLVVARHPGLPGYLLKMYLDECSRTEWPLWILRAKGARIIQQLLDKYYYNCFMKVPQKWIYPVSNFDRPKADENTFPKDFILIVQDMKLATDKYNLYCYKNNMTFARLDALYTIINEGGLSDSHIKNIPFSVDRKIAFMDTEYVNAWPVHFDWLTKYFSTTHQSYWLKMVRERGDKSLQ